MTRLIGVIVASSLVVGACARVRPHERQNLSRRTMAEEGNAGADRFGHHRDGSREGADGGGSTPGGGCGCN